MFSLDSEHIPNLLYANITSIAGASQRRAGEPGLLLHHCPVLALQVLPHLCPGLQSGIELE